MRAVKRHELHGGMDIRRQFAYEGVELDGTSAFFAKTPRSKNVQYGSAELDRALLKDGAFRDSKFGVIRLCKTRPPLLPSHAAQYRCLRSKLRQIMENLSV